MEEQFKIPPHPAGVVTLLQERGHTIAIRRNKHGSFRYRIDAGRELTAIEMDRFYMRRYERYDTKTVRRGDSAPRHVAKSGGGVPGSRRKDKQKVDRWRQSRAGVSLDPAATDDPSQANAG